MFPINTKNVINNCSVSEREQAEKPPGKWGERSLSLLSSFPSQLRRFLCRDTHHLGGKASGLQTYFCLSLLLTCQIQPCISLQTSALDFCLNPVGVVQVVSAWQSHYQDRKVEKTCDMRRRIRIKTISFHLRLPHKVPLTPKYFFSLK